MGLSHAYHQILRDFNSKRWVNFSSFAYWFGKTGKTGYASTPHTMDQAYFKDYYHLEREHWWFLVRRKILAERINTLLNRPRQIHSLNVGAATGTTSDMLMEFGEVMSIEYDEECCRFTQGFLQTPIIQGSILELPFEDNQYDLVTAFDVIEHVEDHQKAVEELWRVCKPGGHIAITVPAYQFLWGPHDEINHHFRRYTATQLQQLFAQLKGQVIYTTYYNSFLFLPIAAFRLLVKLLQGLRSTKKEQPPARSDHKVLGIHGWINRLLSGIFHLDYYWLKAGLRFPAGVSIMLFYKKSH